MSDPVVLIDCDKCGTSTPATKIEWEAGFINALCQNCYEPPPLPQAGQQTTSEAPFPVYFFYDRDGVLLHITNDLSTQYLWREIQEDHWWGYLINTIIVKYFDGAERAELAKKKLIKKLAPKYIDLPKDTDPETDKLPIVYTASWEEEPLTQILNVRIGADSLLALKLVAAKECVDRPEWVRSVLYQAIRDGVEKYGLDLE